MRSRSTIHCLFNVRSRKISCQCHPFPGRVRRLPIEARPIHYCHGFTVRKQFFSSQPQAVSTPQEAPSPELVSTSEQVPQPERVPASERVSGPEAVSRAERLSNTTVLKRNNEVAARDHDASESVDVGVTTPSVKVAFLRGMSVMSRVVCS